MTASWIRPDLVLAGRHVRLTPLEPSHASGLYAVGRDAEIWKYVPFAVREPSDMERYVHAALEARNRGECFPFAITEASTGNLIGSTRYYALAPAHRNLEIGYTWLERSHWRTAANSECKYLLLAYAFGELACLRVALRTDARNLRSRAAMERFGAVREGVFRKHMILPDGHVRDSVYYSVTDEDWPGVRTFLEASLERKTG